MPMITLKPVELAVLKAYEGLGVQWLDLEQLVARTGHDAGPVRSAIAYLAADRRSLLARRSPLDARWRITTIGEEQLRAFAPADTAAGAAVLLSPATWEVLLRARTLADPTTREFSSYGIDHTRLNVLLRKALVETVNLGVWRLTEQGARCRIEIKRGGRA